MVDERVGLEQTTCRFQTTSRPGIPGHPLEAECRNELRCL